MLSARLLSSEDCPKRQSLYLSGLEREALTFHQLLSRGVLHGVQVEAEDPGKAASDEVMRLCLSRPIETESTDLLGIAEHVSALAEIVTWCLRTGSAWRRPKPLKLGEHIWTPSCFAIPSGLRRLVLVDRWSERRILQEAHDWETLEGALYGMPVTMMAIVLGAMRDGRRHGPLSKGWLHPRSGELRFRKRDGNGFDGAWEPIYREHFDGTREEWIEAMAADGVMEETFQIAEPVTFDRTQTTQLEAVVQEKVGGLRISPPTRSLSRCFDSIHPCEFRFPCAYF